jgi:hypothetical protein
MATLPLLSVVADAVIEVGTPQPQEVAKKRANLSGLSLQNWPLNFSPFVVGGSWYIRLRVHRNETLLFSRDWPRNREEMLSVSASVDALHTARN